MAKEITHRTDPVTRTLVQIVSPERLREILDADGESYDRPSHFGEGDDWDVGETTDDDRETVTLTVPDTLRAARWDRVDAGLEYYQAGDE